MDVKKGMSIILKQKPMFQVLYALIPLVIASIYYFGWRALAVLALVNIVGFLCEYIFVRIYNQKVSSAVFVTNFLFALSLPPTIPFWIAAVGIAFGVIFGKMVFGGFGRNVFNPAISARAFVYISFGYHLTSGFVPPVGGTFGGFTAWQPNVDALTKATPLVKLAQGESIPILDLFLGNISGSYGETAAVLILIGGIYLILKKTASYRIIVSGILGFLGFQTLFYLLNISGVTDPLSALLSGSILFGIIFMATDPISSSQTTNIGRWIYGALIGVLTVLIRAFSIWPAGITFAILLANMFAPLLNYVIKEIQKSKKAKA